ncbi:phage antirepressor KilAC domain-containing protein [Paraburkholderia mimosarum]|uniref:phage antirepressor KilAC domain-containing protein n=1 Tax=Paraburkholderia mimosarum TaxID=312026 RepID=UPI00048589EC
MRSLETQANHLADLLRKLGFDELTVQRRVQRALDGARSRRTKRAAEQDAVIRYVGCRSVTDIARGFGMTRIDLFEWLRRAGWLHRTADGWRVTDEALSDGWAVLRGRGVVRWVQLTPTGAQEIARRLGIQVGESSNA